MMARVLALFTGPTVSENVQETSRAGRTQVSAVTGSEVMGRQPTRDKDYWEVAGRWQQGTVPIRATWALTCATSGVSTKKECYHAQKPEEPPALAPAAHWAELQQATKSCPGKPQGQQQFLRKKTEVLPQRKNFCLQTNIDFFSEFLTCWPPASHELTP